MRLFKVDVTKLQARFNNSWCNVVQIDISADIVIIELPNGRRVHSVLSDTNIEIMEDGIELEGSN
jgi:hypothetical protein